MSRTGGLTGAPHPTLDSPAMSTHLPAREAFLFTSSQGVA